MSNPFPAHDGSIDAFTMTPQERKAAVSLTSLYALRFFGLFLVLPVFAVQAKAMPGGENATWIGFSMGVYGLTQAMLQIPFGTASDRFGRKPVIIMGLLIFAVGSFVAAAAHDLLWLTIGRALQGAGAISAAVTAFLADSTRDTVRTKAMALVGASIGLAFALSLVLAPPLSAVIGLSGLFAITGVMALAAIAVVVWVIPDAPPLQPGEPVPIKSLLLDGELVRLNLGVFMLQCAQMAAFVVVPMVLVQKAGLPLADHWEVYLPAVLLSFVLMVPVVGWSERSGQVKRAYQLTIFSMALVLAAFAWVPATLFWLGLLLLGFFTTFNLLEAMLPSLLTRSVPSQAKGKALGVYNTTQALGLGAGGILGGVLLQQFGSNAVFYACALMIVLWLAAAMGMRDLPRRGSSVMKLAPDQAT